MWLLKLLAWVSFGIVGLVVAAAIFDETPSNQLQVNTNSTFGVSVELNIKNIGREPITLLEVAANNRAECEPRFANFDNPKEHMDPVVLQVGDAVTAFSKCDIVRTKIKTDKGTFEYAFHRQD